MSAFKKRLCECLFLFLINFLKEARKVLLLKSELANVFFLENQAGKLTIVGFFYFKTFLTLGAAYFIM